MRHVGRLGVLMALTAGLCAPGTAQRVPAAPASNEAAIDDVVVVGRRETLRPVRDPVDYYRRFCFDPNRRTGQSTPPVGDPDWVELDPATRAKFGATDPAVEAFGLVDAARGETLLLKFETLRHPHKLVENRCTLAIIGGDRHAILADRVSRVFAGPPTQRHVGAADGAPALAGWRQWLWTGNPARRSRSWKSVNAGRGASAGGTWIVVIDDDFYDSHDYILGDLKTRTTPDRPLSILTFAYTSRERP